MLATRTYLRDTPDLASGCCALVVGTQQTPHCLQSGSSISDIEDLVSAISSPKLLHMHLPTAPLRTRCEFPAPGGNSFAVWRAPSAGCIVQSGTVELPERGLLLLTGCGVRFYGTTFTGARPPFSRILETPVYI